MSEMNIFGYYNEHFAKGQDRKLPAAQARKALRFSEIDRIINSGEPLTGVSFEEFKEYRHSLPFRGDDEQEYRQALKGDKASLAEREWRTNPLYQIPERLFDSPEVTADREAAIEKFRQGGDLAQWEINVMHTFTNGSVMCDILGAASLERDTLRAGQRIDEALSGAGISLTENEELHFEIWGYEMKVSGIADSEKLRRITRALCDKAYALQSLYERCHRELFSRGDMRLYYIQNAENYLKGTGISVFDISRDKDGNITGLPEDMDRFIRENSDGYSRRKDDAGKARLMREVFEEAVNIIRRGEYNMFRSMTCGLSFRNGILYT